MNLTSIHSTEYSPMPKAVKKLLLYKNYETGEADVRQSIMCLAETPGINIRSVYSILAFSLYLKKNSGRWISRMFTMKKL